MKHFYLLSAAVTALALAPVSAMAQTNTYDDDSGFYVGGNIGGGQTLDMDITGDIAGPLEGIANAAGNVVAGYDFGNNWRVEADAGQMWNDLDDMGFDHGTNASVRATTGMINAIYDFDDSDFGNSMPFNLDRFTPFIGIGAGILDADLSIQAHDTPGVPTTVCTQAGATSCFLRDTDPAFAWQALAGVATQITDNLSWDSQVKYINAGDLSFKGHSDVAANIASELSDYSAFQALTGLRYKFGSQAVAPKPVTITPPPARPEPTVMPEPVSTYPCWDGVMVTDLANCAAKPAPIEPVVVTQPAVEYASCWDGSYAVSQENCPAMPMPTETYVEPQAFLNTCGQSNIAIFNVPLETTPKQMSRLGSMPEFGDSHGLTPSQFYDKLAAKYAANENGDRPYLNYLFKSMGYAGGFKDASAGLFTEEVLPVGTTGLLGLGKVHHYAYSVLPTNDRDRQAFRIQSANGQIVHFMKTCGNYMYACQ